MKDALSVSIRINLKQKLYIGFGFFFLMVILLWVISGYVINDLANRSEAMLKENYQTVESASALMSGIDEMKNQQTHFYFDGQQIFDENAYQQQLTLIDKHLSAIRNNITEPGEEALVNQLDSTYLQYVNVFNRHCKSNDGGASIFFSELLPKYQQTREMVASLSRMNMAAIIHKNNLLKNNAQHAFVILSVIGLFCFFVSVLFIWRYPNKIVNPIRQLITGIREIALKNYEQRLTVNSRDELQQLAEEFNQMATRLDEFEHTNLAHLLFEKRRIDTLIDKMQDAIIGVSEDDVIIFCNSPACQLLQMQRDEIEGQPVDNVSKINPMLMQLIGNSVDVNHRSDAAPLKIYIDNKAFFFSKEIIEVEVNADDQMQPLKAGYVIVLKNITRFLEQNQAKTDFIATISHELKTPLASMKLNIKLLEDERVGSLNAEQQHIVSEMKAEADKMKNISSELLDLAQVESGSIHLNILKVGADQIIEYVREAMEHNRGVHPQVSYDVEGNLPMMLCDPEKTAWVLINLITNALKYSLGSSMVCVSVVREHEMIRFAVQDFGQGIEEQYLNKIFEKYFRIPGSTQEGSGLGLAISKEFIVKQNGCIWVESELGFGSKFNFTLPIAE
jgi:signal transduction histidine kinase